MISMHTNPIRSVVLCGALIVALLTAFAGTSSAAIAPLAPPASLRAAERQLDYWRTRALAAEAKHKIVVKQRDHARESYRTERTDRRTLAAQVDTLRLQIATAVTALGGSADLGAAVAAINTALGGSGSTLARAATAAAAAADTGASDALALQIAGANTALGGSGTLLDRITSVNTTLGGSGTTLDRAGVAASGTSALATEIADASADIGGTGTLDDRITALGTTLGSTGTLDARATTINTALGGSGTTLARATTSASTNATLTTTISDASAAIGGTGTLDDRITALGTTLGSTGTLTAIATAINAVMGGTGTTTARVEAIANELNVIPSTLTAGLAALRSSVGGPATSLEGQLTSVRSSMVQSPGASLRDDLNTLRNFVVNTPGLTFESDLGNIAVRLNGMSAGSNLENRIGSPMLNGSSSSLADALGGSGSIADRIGDPYLGDTGIAALIGGYGSAVNLHGFDVVPFDNATSVTEKLTEVSASFSQSQAIAANYMVMQKGTFSSLAEILSGLDHD